MPNAYIKTLQNSDKTQIVYPQTISSSVLVESGNLYGGNTNELLSDTLGRVVYLSLNQTISGIKNFSSLQKFDNTLYIKNPSSSYYTILSSQQTSTDRTLYLPTGTASKYLTCANNAPLGGVNHPVYVGTNYELTACSQPLSGNWFIGIPSIGTTGIMEIGRYIDFHPTDTSTLDYNVRLDAGTDTTVRSFTFPTTGGQLLVKSTSGAIGSSTQPVYVDSAGTITACTGSYVTLDSAQTITGAKTFNQPLTIYRQTSIANNYYAGINFTVEQTDNNVANSAGAYIRVYDDHDTSSYGLNMVIQAASNLIIGSGESANACYTTDLKDSSSENLYLTSDSNIYFYPACQTYSNHKTTVYIDTSGRLWGAVWNDYAEFRKTQDETEIEAGRVVKEHGDGSLSISTTRLEPGCEIVSDTYGFAVGKTNETNLPIAIVGRVLAYPYENISTYEPGDAVCSGPNGTISKMSREEIQQYPERIIGTVSEIPTYDIWHGSQDIEVNGRIWIRIK